jgi:hypothetical protein
LIFENDDPEVATKYWTLWDALDGTQKCIEDPDLYTENWTGRPIPDHVAERLCAGCPFFDPCRDYARAAGEEHGIWGGETPEMRKRGSER